MVTGALGLVGGLLQEGHALGGGGGLDHEHRALLHHGRQPHGLEVVGLGEGEGLVGPLAGRFDEITDHVRLRHAGHGHGPLLVRELIEHADELLREGGGRGEVAELERHPHPQAERLGLVAGVALTTRLGEPAVAVLAGLVEQSGERRRLGRHGAQVEVVVRLREPGLGQLQGLVGGAEAERLVGAEARLLHHLVEPGRAAGVVGEGGVVVTVRPTQRVDGRLVEATALAPEEPGLDGLPGEVVVEAEDVSIGLDEQAAVHGETEVVDQVGLRRCRSPRRADRRAPGVRAPMRPPRRSAPPGRGRRPGCARRPRRSTAGVRPPSRRRRGRWRWPPAPRGRTGCRRCGCGVRRRHGTTDPARTPPSGTCSRRTGLNRVSWRCVTEWRRSSLGSRSAAGCFRERPSGR